MAKDENKTPAAKPKNTVTVVLRDLVSGQIAMAELGRITFTGKVSVRIGTALRKAGNAVDGFNESVMKIVRDHDGKPSDIGGLELDPKSPKYVKGWKLLDDHRKSALKETVDLTGVKTVTIDELIDAMPVPVDEEGKETGEKKGIKPLIVGPLYWLIKE